MFHLAGFYCMVMTRQGEDPALHVHKIVYWPHEPWFLLRVGVCNHVFLRERSEFVSGGGRKFQPWVRSAPS